VSKTVVVFNIHKRRDKRRWCRLYCQLMISDLIKPAAFDHVKRMGIWSHGQADARKTLKYHTLAVASRNLPAQLRNHWRVQILTDSHFK
jgi:hypothetical protein